MAMRSGCMMSRTRSRRPLPRRTASLLCPKLQYGGWRRSGRRSWVQESFREGSDKGCMARNPRRGGSPKLWSTSCRPHPAAAPPYICPRVRPRLGLLHLTIVELSALMHYKNRHRLIPGRGIKGENSIKRITIIKLEPFKKNDNKMTIYIVRLCMYEIYISLKGERMPHRCEEELKRILDWKWALVEIRIPSWWRNRIRLDTTPTPVFGMKEEKKQQFVL